MLPMNTTLAPTPTRRLRGVLATAASLAATPLLPTDYLDLVAPLRSRVDLRARIVAVIPETADASTIVLRPGRGWRGHLPGQYVRLGVDVDGVRHWRAYSLTSVPGAADGHIRVTVKAIPGGTVSTHLNRDARPGDIVQLEQAAGEFVLAEVAPAKALFVVAGSGVTPVMGMLRSQLAELADVVVVHCATTETDAVFRDELRAFASAGRVRLVERFSDTDGRLTQDQLATIVPDLAQRQTWACGPAGLLDAIEARWAEAGIDDQLHVERFRPDFVDAGDGGTVTFAGSNQDVEVPGTTSLLDAGEQAGVLMPSGCRMGICFGCVVPLRSGAVRDMRTGEVTQAASSGDVSVQTCINTAASSCELDV